MLVSSVRETHNSDMEFRGVDNDRDLGDIRLSGDQVAELAHAILAVKHAIVEVDIEQLSAILNLLGGNLCSLSPAVVNAVLQP